MVGGMLAALGIDLGRRPIPSKHTKTPMIGSSRFASRDEGQRAASVVGFENS